MTAIAAVIFDMDGTLLDTERVLVEAGLRALMDLGHPPRREVLVQLVGLVGPQGEAVLTQAFGPGFDLTRFDDLCGQHARGMLAEAVPERPGAGQLLSHLVALGVPRAVATNSRSAPARRSLDRAGLLRHFTPDLVFGRDHVERPKPAPDLFLLAAQALGVAPEQCLVFEDSDAGTEAGLAAGMRVIQIPDQRAPDGRLTAHPRHALATSLIAGARAVGLHP